MSRGWGDVGGQRNVYHEDESKRMHTADWLGQQASPMVTEHLTYKSPAWHRDHAALESHIQQGDLEAVRTAYQLAISGNTEDPILMGLQTALAETTQWGPLAVMTAAWLAITTKTPYTGKRYASHTT